MTIYGYDNQRFFVPAQNPYGHQIWFATRAERDTAVAGLEEKADAQGLSDPGRWRPSKSMIPQPKQ